MRRSLVCVVMALATACSSTPVDDVDPLAAPTTAEPATTTSSTTTTVPVPAGVEELMASTTMTERGRRLFLDARPTIEDPATFAQSCGAGVPSGASTDAPTHTQGCYVNGRIHLRAPDRAEARALLYVVAAHELLHAAYSSLGPAERGRLDAELVAARAGNERLDERLKAYAEGPTVVNEIHSILGSEFDGLSPALETHYARYFADRSAVVAARQRTLGAREDEIRRLKAEIDDLASRITAMRAAQDARRASGDIGGYNANVTTFNRLVDRHNAQVDALNARIEEYNDLLGG